MLGDLKEDGRINRVRTDLSDLNTVEKKRTRLFIQI
jgi:hypothetical protein